MDSNKSKNSNNNGLSEEQVEFTKHLEFDNTSEIEISGNIIDQVIGQDEAVDIIKKASKQRRHVLLIGDPGTGKSMLGKALAELLPTERLVDVLSFSNPNDENNPLIRVVKTGKGKQLVNKSKSKSQKSKQGQLFFLLFIAIITMIAPWWARSRYNSDVMFAAFFIGGTMVFAALVLLLNVGMNSMMGGDDSNEPKMVVDNSENEEAPFYEATGAHAGALLGDVLHDPFQSGGLGTAAHKRVVGGLIHKAHLGVLFIDEISTLGIETQQELLTALQEKEFPITGQSERSAGAMVRTEPVPCDFILVAAGNLETLKDMHPALRSRIRGYGYEVFMNKTMKDNEDNRKRIAKFVAQEVENDGKIPHFTKDAVGFIIEEAKKRANRKNHFTLRFRELGGIIRAAGDIAVEEESEFVKPKHILSAKKIGKSLEYQIADNFIEKKKEYEVISLTGSKIGRVNGLAVMGSESVYSGIILPIESEVTDGEKREFVATGNLGDIAKEAITNVSAIIKKIFSDDLNKKEVFVQFLQTYEGVEGDSASIAVAIAVISSLKEIPIKQSLAMTGSLSIKGDVLPIGGITQKIEAAIEAGLKQVIVPKSNLEDIVISKENLSKIEVIPVSNIYEVLKHGLDWEGHEDLYEKVKNKLS
ncbi:MAG: ATP-dependent protease LonB [Candidatus Woesearchaeota archaeon]